MVLQGVCAGHAGGMFGVCLGYAPGMSGLLTDMDPTFPPGQSEPRQRDADAARFSFLFLSCLFFLSFFLHILFTNMKQEAVLS